MMKVAQKLICISPSLSVPQMSGKRSRSFKCAVHQRDREITSENDFHILFQQPPFFERYVLAKDKSVCFYDDLAKKKKVTDRNTLSFFPSPLNRMVHVIAMEVLPEERDRKYYADNYSCCPPPLFMIFVTLVEVSEPINWQLILLLYSFLRGPFCILRGAMGGSRLLSVFCRHRRPQTTYAS